MGISIVVFTSWRFGWLGIVHPFSFLTIRPITRSTSTSKLIRWPTLMKIPKTSRLITPQVGHTLLCLAPNSDNLSGYKPAAGKTVEEYNKLDAEDESLVRWKASLGLAGSSSVDTSGPKVAALLVLLSCPLPSSTLHTAHCPQPGAHFSLAS